MIDNPPLSNNFYLEIRPKNKKCIQELETFLRKGLQSIKELMNLSLKYKKLKN